MFRPDVSFWFWVCQRVIIDGAGPVQFSSRHHRPESPFWVWSLKSKSNISLRLSADSSSTGLMESYWKLLCVLVLSETFPHISRGSSKTVQTVQKHLFHWASCTNVTRAVTVLSLWRVVGSWPWKQNHVVEVRLDIYNSRDIMPVMLVLP